TPAPLSVASSAWSGPLKRSPELESTPLTPAALNQSAHAGISGYLEKISLWISGRSFSASGDVTGPRVAIRLGLNTGAKESPISFSATSSGSASAPAGWLRTATSTPSVLKLAFSVHEATCVLILG